MVVTENVKGQVVIWDSLNAQAWLGYGNGKYKLSKSFKTNTQAKKYATQLGKRFKAPIYDKYYGEYIGKYSKKQPATKVKKTIRKPRKATKRKAVPRKKSLMDKLLPF
jgi:hypothetical protein